MKVTKIAILGLLLAASAPLALADRLYGELDTEGGRAVVTLTGVTFGTTLKSATTGTKTLTGAPKGEVSDGDSTDDFAVFDGVAHSMTQIQGFQYLSGAATTPDTLTFASVNASGPTGIRLYTLIEDGYTLRFYLTSVDLSTVVATSLNPKTTATGAFDGDGYVTVSGGANPAFDTTHTDVDFTFTNSTGSRGTAFTTSIIAPSPEPSSLALFGTGLVGLVGVGRRKFFKA